MQEQSVVQESQTEDTCELDFEVEELLASAGNFDLDKVETGCSW